MRGEVDDPVLAQFSTGCECARGSEVNSLEFQIVIGKASDRVSFLTAEP